MQVLGKDVEAVIDQVSGLIKAVDDEVKVFTKANGLGAVSIASISSSLTFDTQGVYTDKLSQLVWMLNKTACHAKARWTSSELIEDPASHHILLSIERERSDLLSFMFLHRCLRCPQHNSR